MKKKLLIISILILVTMLLVCSSTELSNDTEAYPSNQKIVFIIQYINWASGYENNGYYIDINGNVKNFDLSEKGEKSVYDSEMLISYLEGIGDDVISTKVDKILLKNNYDMLNDINQNSKIVETPSCIGAGQYTMYGVIYNNDGTHQLIMIDSEGDTRREQTAKNAIKIKKWIEGLNIP